MAHPRSNFRRVATRATKRQVTWVPPADQGYVAVAGSGATLIASFDPFASGFIKPTVVRTRGQVSVQLAAYSGDLSIVGAIGMGVVSDQAFGIGITAIPEPFDEAGWDGWFVWRSFSYRYEFHTAASSLKASWDFEVDSKAMRKISDNETIVIVAQSQSGAFEISTPLRLLFKIA